MIDAISTSVDDHRCRRSLHPRFIPRAARDQHCNDWRRVFGTGPDVAYPLLHAVMSLLALYGVSLVGTVVWIVNPEVAAALCVSRRGLPPIEVGIVAAVGQMTAVLLLYGFGDQLRRRWRRFDELCARVRLRTGDRLARSTLVVLVTSGLLGFPPVSATATLAAGLRVSVARLFPILFAMRVIRFTAVSLLAANVHWHLAGLGR
jgi:hypothetical protein